MPSYGYWISVGVSKERDLCRGSACVFIDGPLDALVILHVILSYLVFTVSNLDSNGSL